jgi:hypothetical protein
MAASEVEYRQVDPALSTGTKTVPKGDPAGRTVVATDATAPLDVAVQPTDLTADGRSVYRTAAGAGPNFGFENEAVVPAPGGGAYPRVLELLYVQLLATPVNANVKYYPLVVDKAAAVANNDLSATPLTRLDAGGDMAVWEPPEGFLFTSGIRVIISATPDFYTPMAAPEPISVICRTRNA